VSVESLFHGVSESAQRKSALVRPGVAAAVAAVDDFIGRKEKAEPGEVVVEVEKRQIKPGDPRESDADEPVGDFVQRLGETNNLLVEFRAVRSGLTAQDDE